MKRAFFLISLIFLVSCSSDLSSKSLKKEIIKVKAIKCQEPRPEVCPLIYQPVCGKPINKTFSNGCFACMDESVKYFVEGECKKQISTF